MQNLEGKVAVITGGASGIGRSTALALARRGTHAAIADLNAERGRETVRELEGLGVGAVFVRCDVSQDTDVAALRAATLERFGRVDILMNNVGALPVGSFEEVGVAAWERCFQVNLFSYIRCAQAFLPDISAQDEGHIVNTASFAGLLSYDPKTLAYSASKAAVVSLSEGLAVSLRRRNIGVTCLCPGPTATNIGEQVTAHGDASHVGAYCMAHIARRTPDEVAEAVVSAILDRRFLVHGDPPAAHEIVVAYAKDPEGFLDELGDFLERLG